MADESIIGVGMCLDLLVQAGSLLLENGAATYRVEETMLMLGEALGLPSVDVVATPTGFMLQAGGPASTTTRVHRVTRQGVNMYRLAAINRLSRDASAGMLSPAQIAARLEYIRSQRSPYPAWLVVNGVAVACGAMCMLLGGGWRETGAAMLGALMAMLVRMRLRSERLLPLMVTVVVAFVATATSWLGCRALTCMSSELAEIAAVLQLVPGVALVTAIIDLATGDIQSGVIRGAYAVLLTIGIALGMLLFLAWGIR